MKEFRKNQDQSLGMSIIQSKYKEPLSAKISLLENPVVLAQAWKKPHAYMRRHNWYSDVLELDLSANEEQKTIRVAAAICFDATDLDLVEDLRESKEQVEPTIRKEVKSPPAGFRGRNQ
jgi:hypothetical protein